LWTVHRAENTGRASLKTVRLLAEGLGVEPEAFVKEQEVPKVAAP